MLTPDQELAKRTPARPIREIAERLGLGDADLEPYGHWAAKVSPRVLARPRASSRPPRLVLVTAITPTPAGEGKTTTSIGLAMGLERLGHRAVLALREPSLGPCMGVKGGATGGGRAQIRPADRINLHFTGDLHAVTSANNLLSAAVDNHLYFENSLRLDARRVVWRRVVDMNDRSLRQLVLGLGGTAQGVPREAGFDITAASEVMAMLCLAEDGEDLRRRIDRTLVGFTAGGEPVAAAGLRVTGAMLALLKDALMPNLVQTLEGTAAFVHGGPFANIAHGSSSVVATRMAMHLGDYAITEGGFGMDLGGEKFFDIKCRSAGLDPAAVVLVATVRALKMHGGVAQDALGEPNAEAVRRGLANLEKHVENVCAFGEPPVVAINRFAKDTPEELEVIRAAMEAKGVTVALSDHHGQGGEGAVALAEAVIRQADKKSKPYRPIYELELSVEEKIRKVARTIYGARDIVLTKDAERDVKEAAKLGFDKLPICIAKTQNSLSDDPKLLGRPSGFDVTVRRVQINAGAGFLVVITGEVMRMPGLPKKPLAETIDLVDGEIVGLR